MVSDRICLQANKVPTLASYSEKRTEKKPEILRINKEISRN